MSSVRRDGGSSPQIFPGGEPKVFPFISFCVLSFHFGCFIVSFYSDVEERSFSTAVQTEKEPFKYVLVKVQRIWPESPPQYKLKQPWKSPAFEWQC